MAARPIPPVETLRQLLDYNPETGVFTRKSDNKEAGYRCSNGYREVSVNGVPYKAHRLAWFIINGCLGELEIDHLNGVRDDNRICNLRLVTRQENTHNRRLQKGNVSGVNGIYFCKRTKRWVAQITVDGKNKQLGRHKNLEDAIAARSSAASGLGYTERHLTTAALTKV